MPAAVYGRFLRSLIEELFCRRGAAGACADTIVAIWEEVGCPPYTGLTTSKPFERLTRQQQQDTLRAALNLSHFVARKTWLRRCVSPRRFRANRVQRGEPLRSLLVLVYPNFDLLQTAIN